MRYALKIGRFFGISVFVHWTFILVPLWVLFVGIRNNLSWLGILIQLSLSLAVFACVLMHEYGHALTARRFGVRTRDIVLLPIGGLARLESMPRDPMQELVIAVAGPAVNVVIAAILLPLVILIPGELTLLGDKFTWGGFIKALFAINVILVVFNAIPAFPMDGGRVLRSVLAFFLPYAEATTIAARSGQVISVLFFVLGIVSGNPSLFLIAMFVFMLAAIELQGARLMRQQQLAGLPVPGIRQARFPAASAQQFRAERQAYWRMRS